MKTYQIISDYDCVLTINNKSFSMPSHEKFEITNTDNFFVCVYPLKHNLPFAFSVENDSLSTDKNVVLCTSKKINLICLKSNKKSVLILNEEVKVGQTVVSITMKPEYISFKTKTSGIIHEFEDEIQSAKCGTLEDFVTCLLSTTDEKTLLLYNPQKNTLDLFKGKEIKLEKNVITLFKDENTISKHATKLVYTITKSDIVKESEIIMYQTGEPYHVFDSKLYASAFLDAIRMKDFSLARKYLSTTLSNMIDDEHLENFFPFFTSHEIVNTGENFQEVFLLGTQPKLYKFSFSSYIDNIEEEE